MEYIFKVNAVIAIYYLCYKLFLQFDTFFEFNRVFLLLGVITSFLIPLVIIPVYIEYTPLDLSNYSVETFKHNKNNDEFNFLKLLSIAYKIGVIGFSIRFITQLVSLTRIISKNEHKKQEHFTIIKTSKRILPFSFFKWIVYNPTLLNKEELIQIMFHEKVHVKQYHSIDIILTQLTCIILWFNPIIWFYFKDLKQNLEFIADKNAQQKAINKKNYQYTLLKTTLLTHQLEITNNFYSSLIKKRIVMLQKTKSKKINLFKYTLVIPILVVFILNFNTKVYAQIKDSTKTINITGKSDAGVILKLKESDNPLIIIDGKESEKTNLNDLNNSNIESINILKGDAAIKVYGDKGVNGVVQIKSKTSDLQKSPSIITINESLYFIDGKEVTKEVFEKINPENIKSMNVYKKESATSKYGEKGKNGVIEIITK
ncbi:M56 family metallopeptidase [uncultured Algibacter sp.]|uniref:M56 family metallopeptidase n=1 Tax=uncultured Algibacter sp. TaxID=298659 RepID=UPI00260BACCE|nr:M56 family metallopeptidase [uncultured Algibacter sp.]